MREIGTDIPAAEAVKHFRRKPLVQTATPVETQDASGRKRVVFNVKDEELAAAHIMAAKRFSDRVVIVTIDGKKHAAPL